MQSTWTTETYRDAKTRLRAAAEAYYTTGDIVMSDADYDQLARDVAEYETQHPADVAGDAVSEQVAAGTVSGDVEHSVPMLSLDNVFSIEDLEAWTARKDVSAGAWAVEPKLDGLSAAIRYEDGRAVLMATRGDGLHGEDVTYALGSISNLPVSPISDTFTAEVRGEVIFSRDQFEQANSKRDANGDKPFSNARNGAAGALRGAKDRDYLLPLSFVAYDLIDGTDRDHSRAMGLLEDMGFTTARSLIDADGSPADVVQRYASIEAREALPFETDGMVIKADRPEDRQRLGAGSKSPRWAVAYKYPAVEQTSVLRDVLWQVGRTGVITPRAVIDKVFVSGTWIQYATLHNPDDLARKGFMLGDTVLVKRAGEVIPRLEAPLVALRDGTQQPIPLPETCPRCNGPIDRSQARWRCEKGRDCGVAESLAYAVSRDALDIEGLGPKQVTQLIERGVLTDLADLFERCTNPSTLFNAGIGQASTAKIAPRIEQAKIVPLARFITALGLTGTGRSMSRHLAKHFRTLEAFRAATIDDLAAVETVGPIKATSIRMQLDDLSDVLDRLQAAGVTPIIDGARSIPLSDAPDGDLDPFALHEPTERGEAAARNVLDAIDGSPLAGPGWQTPPALTGMKVVVTGTMTGALAGLSRNAVNELIEEHGGTASGSVSKNTDLLVVGENAGSKKQKAEQLGVQIATEAQFAAIIGK